MKKEKKAPSAIVGLLREKKGMSLVEEIVAIVLLVIICSTLYMLVCSGASLYYKAKSTSNARNVSSILMDKITGEIAGAQIGTKSKYTMTVSDERSGDGTYFASEKGEYIAFYTRTGSPVYITAVDGEYLEHYRPVDDGIIKLGASDWRFDKHVYMGHSITELRFEIMYRGTKTNIIKTTLVVRNDRTGYEYSSSKYTECYNFTSPQDVAKLKYGGIHNDEAFMAAE